MQTDTELAQGRREAAERPAQEREVRQAHRVQIRSDDGDSWNAWADGRINAALE
jgi:hypothetical protein